MSNYGYNAKDVIEWNKHKATPTVPVPAHWNREHWIEDIVKSNNLTTGAELGVWRGRTFLHLLENCPNLTLYGVDVWAEQPDNTGPENYIGWNHNEYERHVRTQSMQYGSRAKIIKSWTTEAAKQIPDDHLDFIFIDADHSEEAVRADIEAWAPKVKIGGWILGHDINWPPVKAIVDELIVDYTVGPDNAWGRQKISTKLGESK